MTRDELYMIRPGSRVKFTTTDGITDAVVTGATVRAIGVTAYEVAWWSGRTRSTAWVEPHEIEAAESPERLRIGFGRQP